MSLVKALATSRALLAVVAAASMARVGISGLVACARKGITMGKGVRAIESLVQNNIASTN
jgi:glycine cleavage system pyridoxal-binding protein P